MNKANKELSFKGKSYTYFAFISYKREDDKWAEWLQKKLQTYRLPGKLCRKYPNIQDRCVPVFLDKSNLKPGILKESLRSEVQDSKYLIIICSKKAHQNSTYIDMETQQFIEGCGDPTRIIPVIVDDSNTPEKDCFPPYLQKICEESNLVGVNVHEYGKHKALLKIIAYMHGLKVEEIESVDDLRRKRNRIKIATLSSVSLLALVIGWYKVWDYYVPKIHYYADYIEESGIPVGINPLSKNDLNSVNDHYAIISNKGAVRELRHENSYGLLTPYDDMIDRELADRPILALYTYTDDREHLESVKAAQMRYWAKKAEEMRNAAANADNIERRSAEQ